MTTPVPVALTIAGSDSSGGAGIQADLKTFAAHKVYGASVITALTAQNTRGVVGIEKTSPDFVAAQLKAVLDDVRVTTIKTGMLVDADTIDAVAAVLDNTREPLVIDPVLIAKSGHALLDHDAVATLKQRLLPRATLVTPNLPEVRALTGIDVHSVDDAARAGRVLLDAGAGAVLVKGGHGEGDEIVDVLVLRGDIVEYRHPRIATTNTHGTGCTLSAAITARLARKIELTLAVASSIAWLQEAIATAPQIGTGHGPVNHLVRPHLER